MKGPTSAAPGPHGDGLVVELHRISPERRSWHVRRTYHPREVLELAEAIRQTGVVEPLEVLPEDGGVYPLVSGWLRYLALTHLVEDGFPDAVPVRVVLDSEPLALLQRLYLTGAVRFPLRTLEVGWAMHALEALLRERRLPHDRTDICRRLGLTNQKSLASEAWAAAEAVPLEVAQAAELDGVVDAKAVGRTPRSALREFRKAPSGAVPALRDVLFGSFEQGRSPTKAVRAARERLAESDGSESAEEAVTSGRRTTEGVRAEARAPSPLTTTRGTSASPAGSLLMKLRMHLLRIVRGILAFIRRVRGWRRGAATWDE